MIHLKTPAELEKMRSSNRLVAQVMEAMLERIKPGVSTWELDQLAEKLIGDAGARPAFKGYQGFPATICASVNEQVVHGIPTDRPLQDGDIIAVDCGAIKNGWWGDHAFTFAVGEVSDEVRQLLTVTEESLYKGIEETRLGNHTGDIGFAVQLHAERHGYGVVRELVGHGLGRDLHEDPELPNYGRRGKGKKLVEGMVLAIEPMINMGSRHVVTLNDGWTIVTKDGKPSAHFEHDVAIIDGKPEILSSFTYVYEALGIPDPFARSAHQLIG